MIIQYEIIVIQRLFKLFISIFMDFSLFTINHSVCGLHGPRKILLNDDFVFIIQPGRSCFVIFFFRGNFQLGTASDVLLIYRGFSLFSQSIFAHFFQKFSSFFSFFSSVHLAPSKFIWSQSKELFHFFRNKATTNGKKMSNGNAVEMIGKWLFPEPLVVVSFFPLFICRSCWKDSESVGRKLEVSRLSLRGSGRTRVSRAPKEKRSKEGEENNLP